MKARRQSESFPKFSCVDNCVLSTSCFNFRIAAIAVLKLRFAS
nr:MAG TPA: hypothetical protein [Caudoviricetes sp.]